MATVFRALTAPVYPMALLLRMHVVTASEGPPADLSAIATESQVAEHKSITVAYAGATRVPVPIVTAFLTAPPTVTAVALASLVIPVLHLATATSFKGEMLISMTAVAV